jgi:osmotically-inducible protein OsmY
MSTSHDALATRANTVLEQHPHLKRRRLRIETAEGRVVLRGTVASYYQKQMAQEALRRVEGVDHIENHLEVAWS